MNALDVSNFNTAQVFGSINPVASTYARAIASVSLSTGALTITDVNALSSNNGRAAVLANGNYYLIGNAGNGSGNGTTLSQLSDNTGVQRISALSSGNTTAVGLVQGTYGSSTGYQRGFSLVQEPDRAAPSQSYAPDKTGKDDNFRGETVFNNTLYVTKGSGSNGVNSVCQVGAAGALAHSGILGNAAATIPANPIATPHPFGIWFGNATTLFVADEGDGVRLGVAGKNATVRGLAGVDARHRVWSPFLTF